MNSVNMTWKGYCFYRRISILPLQVREALSGGSGGGRRYGGKIKKTAAGADADGLVSSGDRADSCGRWLTGAGSRYVQ